MEYRKILDHLYEKGETIGITKEDVHIIKKCRDELETIINYYDSKFRPQLLKEEQLLYEEYAYLLYTLIDVEGIYYQMSNNNINYIRENSQLLGLVLANDRYRNIKLYAMNSFKFLCQFHEEKTPSLGVVNDKQYYYCFGCGLSGDIFQYIMRTENVHFLDAVRIVAAIFKIELPNNYFKNSKIVKYYLNTILSDEYLKLLYTSMDRCRNLYSNSYMQQQLIFDQQVKQIERLSNGNFDESFVYEAPKENVYIKKRKKPNDSEGFHNLGCQHKVDASNSDNEDNLPF